MKQILNPYEGQASLSASVVASKLSRTVNVHNLPLDISQNQIVEYFKQFGKAERLWLKTQGDNQCCSILYKLGLSAEAALKAHGKQLMGRPIQVFLLKHQLENHLEDRLDRKVMVSGLKISTRPYDIQKKLMKGIQVKSVQLFKEKGKDTMSAMVELSSPEESNKAMNRSGTKLEGNKVQVAQVDSQVEDLIQNMRQDLLDIQDKIISEDIQDDIEPIDSFMSFKNTSVVIGNYEDIAEKNVISVPPREIRKQIKKAKQKNGEIGGTKLWDLQQKVKKKFEAKNDKELFNNRNEREVRKQKRRVQQEINNLKKQGKNDKIKLLFEKKKELDYKITRKVHMY